MRTITPKILIADDDEAIIDATTMILEFMGYKVDSTLDGSTIPAIVQNHPDLIILDVWMAGVEGRDICKLLKSNPSTSNIPVIMISASRDIKDSVLACGADDFLEKPFEIEMLVERIEKLIA